MTDPRKDLRRRCMPIDEWPPAFQHAWQEALRKADPFGGSGRAAHWRDGTRRKVASSVGRWLTFLEFQGLLRLDLQLDDHLEPTVLRAYVEELSEQVASITAAQRIIDLGEATRVMAPDADTSLLRQVGGTLKARARPRRDKRARYIHPERVVHRALALMDEIETNPCQREAWRAGRYRDALILAIVSSRAIRRRNLCAIEVGRHLIRQGDIYTAIFEGDETKNHRYVEDPLPATLTACIDRYIDHYRPVLLEMSTIDTDRLWISNLGTEMSEVAIYNNIRALTKREFGIELNLHAFRDCAATAVALDDPKHVGIASTLLTHADPRITQEHYNLAQTVEAARDYQQTITRLRTEARRPRRSRKKT